MRETTRTLVLLTYFMWADGLFTTSKCSDSMVDGHIMADCRRRGLVNIFDLHLDVATTVLDLSDNEFERLGPNQFLNEGLTYLEKITLRNNQIDMIDSQSFNGLARLTAVDLSKNRISVFSLAYMPPLRTLNISQNPLTIDFTIYSTTLEVLDLSHCNLPQVPIRHYSDLPRLQHLNLSYNRIEKIFLPALQHTNLRSIQFYRNPVRCTEETYKVINWFERQLIQFSPMCLRPQGTYSPAAVPIARNPPVFTRPHSLPSEIRLPEEPSHDECLLQLSSMRNEHRLMALISLAIHLVILVLVLIFFGLFLSYRFQDKKKTNVETVAEVEEDSEVPPPPYRYRHNVSGFRI